MGLTATRRARPSRRNAGRPPDRFAAAGGGDDDDDDSSTDEDFVPGDEEAEAAAAANDADMANGGAGAPRRSLLHGAPLACAPHVICWARCMHNGTATVKGFPSVRLVRELPSTRNAHVQVRTAQQRVRMTHQRSRRRSRWCSSQLCSGDPDEAPLIRPRCWHSGGQGRKRSTGC